MTDINEIQDKQTRDFAIACYDQNSIQELREAQIPDATDMENWGITADQWKQAVNAALNERLNDRED